MPWHGTFLQKAGFLNGEGREGLLKLSPLKFGFPGPSGGKSTQISLHGNPQNLGFDSVSREPKTGVQGS